MKSDREIGPALVADMLGIPVARARRYMREGVVRSFVGKKTDDGRRYRFTFESEVQEYRRRRLASLESPPDRPMSTGPSMRFEEIWN
jgi:hypothetical protein